MNPQPSVCLQTYYLPGFMLTVDIEDSQTSSAGYTSLAVGNDVQSINAISQYA